MITVIGSLNYDLVTFTERVPEGGETIQAISFENHLGGKGLNETLACARLSEQDEPHVRMIGNVGADSFGVELRQVLVDAKVDTQLVKTIEDSSSGVAVIIVETSGENRILITAGANGKLDPTHTDLQAYFKEQEHDNDFVILQNEFPSTVKCIDWIKSQKPKINIAYNPSPFIKERITSEILNKIDFLIVNEGEALDVANCLMNEAEIEKFKSTIRSDEVEGYKTLAKKLQSMMCQNNISSTVITLGSLGSVFVGKGLTPKFVPSEKVEKVVDTTGAGDTFFGGVVSQLSNGKSLESAIKFATIASGLTIQKKGAAEGIPFFKEVQKKMPRS